MAVAPVDQSLLAPRSAALPVAVGVAVLGFGALTVFSGFGLGTDGLPGLFTFRAATIGDGLLLPLLSYAFVRASGGVAAFRRRVVAFTSVVFFLAGAAVQAQWLLNPQPRVNWTLPQAHYFTMPGWWHAAFFALVMAFLGGAAIAVVARLRDEGIAVVESRIRSLGAVGTLATAFGFMALLAVDNAATPRDVPQLLALHLGTSAVLALVLLGLATRGRLLGRAAQLVITALLPAGALAYAFPRDPRYDLWIALVVVIAGLTGVFAAGALAAATVAQRCVLSAILLVCAVGPIHQAVMAAAEPPRLITVAVVGVVLVLTATLALRLLRDDRADPLWTWVIPLGMVPVVGYALTGQYFAAHQPANPLAVNLTGVMAAALFVTVTGRSIRAQFKPVIEAEQDGPVAPRLGQFKMRAYAGIAVAYVGAVLASIVFAGSTTPAADWIAGSVSWADALRLGGVVAIIAVTCAGLALTAALPIGRGTRHALVIALCLGFAAALAASIGEQGFAGWLPLTLSALAGFVTFCFVTEGIISNAGYLQNVAIGWGERLVAVACGIAGAATTVWMTGPALQSSAADTSRGVVPGLVGLLVGAAACLLIPALAALTLPGVRPPRQFTPNRPLHGILQDSFVVLVLAVSAAWVPTFFFAHVQGLANWWGLVLFYLALMGDAYKYVMKNNLAHVRQQRERIHAQAATAGRGVTPDEDRALAGLERHVVRQNVLAVVPLFALLFLVIPSVFGGLDDEGFNQYFKV
ncbi:hypothetical protein [Herbidospora mongoliensis]|uniref:hypothetical protein n=1 Tax=Herbidospora mongoliensis TaxID=688067 RepID=UPI0008357A90|nr:hypothetical protein [Herbidospora mongoliensis]